MSLDWNLGQIFKTRRENQRKGLATATTEEKEGESVNKGGLQATLTK